MRWVILLLNILCMIPLASACRSKLLKSTEAFDVAESVYLVKVLTHLKKESHVSKHVFHVLQTFKGERPLQDQITIDIQKSTFCKQDDMEVDDLRVIFLKSGQLQSQSMIHINKQIDDHFVDALQAHSRWNPLELNPFEIMQILSNLSLSDTEKLSVTYLKNGTITVGSRKIEIVPSDQADLEIKQILGFQNGYTVFVRGELKNSQKMFNALFAQTKDGGFERLWSSLQSTGN